MPPRTNRTAGEASRAIENRKLKKLSKVKDSDKLTEDEFQQLLNVAEDKIKRISSCYDDLRVICKAAIDPEDPGKGFPIDLNLFGNRIEICLNLEIKREKNSIKLIEPFIYCDFFDLNFLGRITEIAPSLLKNSDLQKVNVFERIKELCENGTQFIDEYYINDKAWCLINKSNITQFIKDCDLLLGFFLVNPEIGSPTNSKNHNLIQIQNILEWGEPFYNIIREEHEFIDNKIKEDPSSRFVSYPYDTKSFIILSFRGMKFKFSIRISRHPNKECSLAIVIQQWNDVNGWVFLDSFDDYNKILKYTPIPKYSTKPDQSMIFQDGSIDECIRVCLNFICSFNNLKPVFIK